MSRAIWKYELNAGNIPEALQLPVGAKVLAFGNQNGAAVIWVEGRPTEALEKRCFAIYGTGHEMPDNPGNYIGTAQFMGGSLVFHAYETPAPS